MPAEKLEHVPVKSDFFYFDTFEARTLFTQLFEIVKNRTVERRNN